MRKTEPLPTLLILATLCSALPAEAGVNWWTPVGPEGGYISSLAVDRATRTVYAGAGGGVFVSTNGGGGWERRSRGLSGGSPVAASSLPVPIVYAAGDQDLYRSTDAGASWTRLGLYELGWNGIYSLAVDPDRAGVLYLSAYIYVDVDVVWITYKSTDDGKTWTRLNVEGAPVLAASSGLVVVGKHRSTDGGSTWQELPLPLVPTSLAFDPADPATLYAGLFPGVYKSTDAGATWSLGNRGLFASSIQTLAIDPQQPTLYAWVQGLGLRKGVAGGTRWRRADAGLPLDAIFGRFETPALAIDPVVTSNLYLGWKNGFARSSDRK